MRLFEDQSKALLRQEGLPVPRGEAARSADEANQHAKMLAGPDGRVAIKALIAAGRRGKAWRGHCLHGCAISRLSGTNPVPYTRSEACGTSLC